MAGANPDYQILDELWAWIGRIPPKPGKKLGWHRKDDRKAIGAIFHPLRSGCRWKALPHCLGASSAAPAS